MRAIIITVTAIALAGCDNSSMLVPLQLKVTAHEYCQIAEKATWVPTDSPRTIQDARREDAKIDKLCTTKAKPAS